MEIRDATPADLPAIVEIYNLSIPARLATADTEPVSVADRQAWFDKHDPARRPLWVADDDGMIAGWADLRDFYGRPAYHATAEIAVYLHPDYQGIGLGTDLKRQVIAACPDLGVKTLLSFVFGHNAASIRVNEKLGFEKWAHLPHIAELDGIERDLVIYGLRIE